MQICFHVLAKVVTAGEPRYGGFQDVTTAIGRRHERSEGFLSSINTYSTRKLVIGIVDTIPYWAAKLLRQAVQMGRNGDALHC
jgi:hypothetical protein